MTDPYNPTFTPTVDDLDTPVVTPVPQQPTGPAPLRDAVREDAHQARLWAEHRAARTRDAIREKPLHTTLYALGAGVLLGLILAR
ncbi:hypothetical protein [Brevundimonas sp.]|uniref:DUF883 family protein n=1 Tax=Brevundimonas sp. TaxID=1871086 RepID=UPI002ABC6AA0|nr:hypothetical protein [Brevundimonas sp.]MDZ4364583.1 hypothetical protein [Brevundimonas sp.]